MGATSKHFAAAELQCRCGCGHNGCAQALVDALEAFRAAVGLPVIVDSGYRCPEHNIRVAGHTAEDMETVARTIPAIKGIGRSDHGGFLHMDVRQSPGQWCYAANGQQCAYYPPA